MRRRFVGKAAIGALLLAAGLMLTNSWASSADVFDQLDLLVDVRHELMQNYVEEPDAEAMTRSAVRGMVESLDDPYTVYLPPDELDAFERGVSGKFSGIGAKVDMFQGRLRIISPLEDSPAWEAGVMAGDIVLEIEGASTRGMQLTEAVDKLTGEAGTDVTITVRHETGEEETITITRDVINVHTVRGFDRGADREFDYVLDEQNGIGYVRISQFSKQTAKELRQALQGLKKRNINGLILDVRFNPGGLLTAAREVSNMFLDQGQTIVSVDGRKVDKQVYKAKDKTIFPDLPVVVLANEASASASEIVTGALKDNERARFVGTRTFGKGSVQQLRMLESGQGALKVTNAYYYLPSGRNIHRREDSDVWGVDPSAGSYVPMSQEQTREMIELRREKDVLRRQPQTAPATQSTITPEHLRQQRKDPQLAAALEAVRARVETGNWPKVGKSNADQLARARREKQLMRQRDALQEELDKVRDKLQALQAGDMPATQPTASTQPADGAEK